MAILDETTHLQRLQTLHDSVLAPPVTLDQEIDHAIAECVAAFVVDLETGVIVRATTPAELLFGFDPGELKGKMIHDLVPVEMRAAHRVWFKRYAELPSTRPMGVRGVRIKGLGKDGREFPVEIGLAATSINGIHVAIALVLPMVLRELMTGVMPVVRSE